MENDISTGNCICCKCGRIIHDGEHMRSKQKFNVNYAKNYAIYANHNFVATASATGRSCGQQDAAGKLWLFAKFQFFS